MNPLVVARPRFNKARGQRGSGGRGWLSAHVRGAGAWASRLAAARALNIESLHAGNPMSSSAWHLDGVT